MKTTSFRFKKLFKEEDGRFIVLCGLKFSGVFAFAMASVCYVIWVMISMNSIFFESQGYLGSIELREAFFDHSLMILFENLPLIFTFLVGLFFSGMYVGKSLIRPFEIIGNFCEAQSQGKKEVNYNPDIFSDYRLLTRFSEFFFSYIENSRRNKKFAENVVPNYYSKIHKPMFEKVFFFHFMTISIAISLASCLFCGFITLGIQDQIIEMSLKTISKNGEMVAYFLKNQNGILESTLWFFGSAIMFSYAILSFHLYSKVDGAIFAFFSTMRSFIKGNRNARVHLIGYGHIRPYGRKFNKYLEFVLNEFSNEKYPVESKISILKNKSSK